MPTVDHIKPGDDIQAIINNAAPGSTIEFNPGTYQISGTITLRSNLTYEGMSGATLQATGNNTIMRGDGVSNVTVQGINFDGGPTGINVQDANHAGLMLTSSSNVNVVNNSFNNIQADASVFV